MAMVAEPVCAMRIDPDHAAATAGTCRLWTTTSGLPRSAPRWLRLPYSEPLAAYERVLSRPSGNVTVVSLPS